MPEPFQALRGRRLPAGELLRIAHRDVNITDVTARRLGETASSDRDSRDDFGDSNRIK